MSRGPAVSVSAALWDLLAAAGVVDSSATSAPTKDLAGAGTAVVATTHRRLPSSAVELLASGWGAAAALAVMTSGALPAKLPKPLPPRRGVQLAVDPPVRREHWDFVSTLLNEKLGVALPTERRELLMCGDVGCAVSVLESALALHVGPQKWRGKRFSTRATAPTTTTAATDSGDVHPPPASRRSPAPLAGPKHQTRHPQSRDTTTNAVAGLAAPAPAAGATALPPLEQVLAIQELQQQYLQQCLFYMSVLGAQAPQPQQPLSTASLPPPPPPPPPQPPPAPASSAQHGTSEQRAERKKGRSPAVAPREPEKATVSHATDTSTAALRYVVDRNGIKRLAAPSTTTTTTVPKDPCHRSSLDGTLSASPAARLPPLKRPAPAGRIDKSIMSTLSVADQVRMRLRLRDGGGHLDASVIAVQAALRHLVSCALVWPRLRALHRAAALIGCFVRFRMYWRLRRHLNLNVDPYSLPGCPPRPTRVGCTRCWPILLALRERLVADPLLANSRVRKYRAACCERCRDAVLPDFAPMHRKVDFITLRRAVMLQRFARSKHSGIVAHLRGCAIADELRGRLLASGIIPNVDL